MKMENKAFRLSLLTLMRYLYFTCLILAAITLLLQSQFVFMAILLVVLGIYMILLEAFEKDLKHLRLTGKGVEIAMEMETEAKAYIKEEAKTLSRTIEEKTPEEKQRLLQEKLDEAFNSGLRVGGYKSFYEINNFK